MSINITGADLSIDKLYQVSYQNAKVSLGEDSITKINKCRKMVEDKIDQGEIMYGINTGIGEFSETILDDEKLEDFQKYLIYNHAAGMGDPFPIEYVRAAMTGRINVHAKGHPVVVIIIIVVVVVVVIIIVVMVFSRKSNANAHV